ncbi:Nucleolar MIF4G domain-containing protein 1 [Thelohanellus kitauei]|uniref:Nucleolar MIF4G domain-containing protein 1 n=1 Tax=Thelohanellus kitauei TaxID=669202 RepID=A0A0C2N6J7_THEKT|nr:Nucleolar MIF4G domain-containing protein 1 [Thelohanellus kitauei]
MPRVVKKSSTKVFNEQSKDDMIISKLSKKLKIKNSAKLPSRFYNEGYGELIDMCDEVLNQLEQKTEKHNKSFKMSNDHLKIDEGLVCAFKAHKTVKPKPIVIEQNDDKNYNPLDLEKSILTIFNKLSDKNIADLLQDFRILYRKYGFNETSAKFTDLFIKFVIQPQLLPDRLLLSCTAFLSIIHFIFGNEIMSVFMSALITKFNSSYDMILDQPLLKEPLNAISVICCLYFFDNVGCGIIKDTIDKLLIRFSEQDVEMILKIMTYCGFQLRKENPAIFKEIIKDVHERCKKSERLSLRASFMLETISAIQYNNPSKLTQYDPLLFDSFSKIHKSILKANTQLEGFKLDIKLNGFKNPDHIINCDLSCSGHCTINVKKEQVSGLTNDRETHTSNSKWSKELTNAAKGQRYNDKVKIDIFCTLMTSKSPEWAFTHLNLLNLDTKGKELIVRICIEICLQENEFNVFYCDVIYLYAKYHPTYASSTHFTIRDQLRKLQDLEHFSLENLRRLIIELLSRKSIKISIFKIVDYNQLKPNECDFYRKLFLDLISIGSHGILRNIFSQLYNEKWHALRQDILYFLMSEFHQDQTLMQRIKIVSSIAHSVDASLSLPS